MIELVSALITVILLHILQDQDRKTHHITLSFTWLGFYLGLAMVVITTIVKGTYGVFAEWLLGIIIAFAFFYVLLIWRTKVGTKEERIMYGGDFWVLIMIQSLNPFLFTLPSLLIFAIGGCLVFIFERDKEYTAFVPYLFYGYLAVLIAWILLGAINVFN